MRTINMGECCLPEGEEVGSRVGLVVGSTVGLSNKSNASVVKQLIAFAHRQRMELLQNVWISITYL